MSLVDASCHQVKEGSNGEGVEPLMFPKVPQSSQMESLGFPSYIPPFDTLPQEPYNHCQGDVCVCFFVYEGFAWIWLFKVIF